MVTGSPTKLELFSNRKIFEARKRETAALGAGEKLVLGHPLPLPRCISNARSNARSNENEKSLACADEQPIPHALPPR